MWECPDYFEMNGRGVLLFSPQGIEGDGDLYNNIFQSGYLIGEPLNLQTREFDHDHFQELDRGFDFYAPQSMEAPDGRRILIGWMGLPDVEYPTDASGWAHCLTIPRQLSLKDSKLIQQPVDEMKKLRQQSEGHRYQTTLENRSESVAAFNGTAYELECEISHVDAERFGIEFRTGGEEKTVLQYDRLQQKLILDRTLSGAPMGGMNGTVRQCTLNGDRIKLQLFVDTSSVEIFVNDGEEVFTSRIFPSPESTGIRFFASGGKAEFKATKWDY
jgi:beta-fructofuranosidase